MKDTLKTLCLAYGPTGNEYNVAEIIKGMVAPYVDEMKMDAMGNLITVKKGQEGGKKIMLAAHMDHIGFVVTDIDEKGFARVHNVGGIRKANSLYRKVVFENGVCGILAGENEGHNVADNDMTKLFIDLGASSKEEAMKLVQPGDFAVYAGEFTELQNNLVAGTAMDDRAGCAILIEMLKRLGETKNEIVAVFTVQEEVGLRGAQAAAFDVAPDMGIALDVTLCGDTPKGPKIAVKAGAGIAVKILDNSLICHPGVVKAMEEAAERAGAKYQREVLTAGGTDAGAIQRSRGGVPSGVLSIPCRYVHSPNETVSLDDMENGVKLLCELLKA